MDNECRCELCVWYPPAPQPIPSMTGNLEDGIPMTKAYNPADDWREQLVKPQPEQPRPNRPHTHRVDVTLTSGGFGQVLVDGTDVSAICTGLSVFSVPRRGPKVVLELDGRPVKVVSDAAAVEVGGDTYDLLVGLGWTPPAAPQVPNGHRAPHTDGTKCSGHGLPYLSPDDDRCEQCVAEQVAPDGNGVQ